jgi:hypothetical protein
VQALAGLGGLGIGETIASIADRVFSIAKEAGDIGYKAFEKVWPILSDPKKGVPLAIVAIKSIEYFAPDPNYGFDQLSNFADWLQSYDPSQILGPQPPQFYVNWDQINQWIPDEQCSWGDVLCGTRNALRSMARGIIGGFAAIGSFIYWGLWNLAYYALKALFYLGSFIIKYLIIPIGKALMTIIANVFTVIKKAFCAYIQYVAPFVTIYRAVYDVSTGKKLWGGIDIIAGIVLPMAFVSQDCGFPSPLPISVPSVPSPIQQPVYTPPPNFRYAYDYYLGYDNASAIMTKKMIEAYDIIYTPEGTIGA